MCECLTWHHPVWRAAARVARCQPDTVFAVFSALDDDGAAAARLRPEILAAGLGRRSHVIERILASLASLGVTCDGVVTAEWRRRPPGGAEHGLSMKPSAVRMRRKRSIDRAAADHFPAASSSPAAPVTCDAVPLCLSFFPDNQALQEKEQKQPRARASDDGDGFAELRALWPLTNRMAEAEHEYRRARRSYGAAEILAAANHYLDTKPGWQSPLFLLNWLRIGLCRDPVLPLASPPREVAATTTAPLIVRPDLLGRRARLEETGVWEPEWGPSPAEPGCLMPINIRQGFVVKRWLEAQHRERESA